MKAKQIYLFKQKKTQNNTSGKVYVNGYRRINGVYVKPYWRKHPGRQLGTRRNVNVKKHKKIFSTSTNHSSKLKSVHRAKVSVLVHR